MAHATRLHKIIGAAIGMLLPILCLPACSAEPDGGEPIDSLQQALTCCTNVCSADTGCVHYVCGGTAPSCFCKQAPAAAGTLCRPANPANQLCDRPEVCDGQSTQCPADGMQPAGFPCIPDNMDCTLEICDGNGTCTHPPAPWGRPCRAPIGACDQWDYCMGGPNCGFDFKRPVGSMCRPAVNECDLAETCNGGSFCPADVVVPAGTPCTDDGNSCSVDTCNGVVGAPACTQAWLCPP